MESKEKRALPDQGKPESERRFAIDLVRQLAVPTFVLDADGRVIVWNEACERLTGVNSQEVIGTKEHWRAFYEQPRPCLADLVLHNGIGDGGELYVSLDNSEISGLCTRAENWCAMPTRAIDLYLAIDASPIRDHSGQIIAVVETLRDLTDQKRSEALLNLNASVFENSQIAVVITDADGNLISANKTFTEITGYTLEEVRGKNPRLLQSGEHTKEFYRDMWECVRTKGGWSGEVIDRKKNGQIFPAILNLSAVRGTNGEVMHYVSTLNDITTLKDAQQRLERLVHFEPLTGLPNRVLLADRMQQALAAADRSGGQLAVCFLDLDGFKAVNDRFGHHAGDRLLIEVAHRLERVMRCADTLARIGGDEFILLLTDVEGVPDIEMGLARILEAVAQPFQIEGNEVSVSASVGVTHYPCDKSDADALLRHADQAMYEAKQLGRKRFHMFDTERDRDVQRSHLKTERIREALAQDELRLYYQPKVNLSTGEVIGAEALLRWQHPERGLVGPMEFLPQVEHTDLIIDIEEWVLGNALSQMAEWGQIGVNIPISVNIAARHFHRSNFVPRLSEILDQHPKVPKQLLELEILESSALEDIEQVRQVIADCQALGVGFALDDFGTGYSSLTYLKRLRANVLKIDRSFVMAMLNDKEDLAIIDGIIGLAEAFNMQVIAEGVETVEHGIELVRRGCPLAQGYAIARAMPGSEIPAWIRAFRPHPDWVQ